MKLPDNNNHDQFIRDISGLLEEARRQSARAVNSILTATYWEIGRRITEYQQQGSNRAEYGTQLLKKMSVHLTQQFGRGFSERNLEQMRQFYLCWPISQTLSAKSGALSHKVTFQELSQAFPLSWSHYVLLLSIRKKSAQKFYETEALRGGWSVRISA